jgi:predicted RNA-binding protein with PIN domain
MALHIIIDGYNVIGSERGLGGKLEAVRDHLIHDLQQYQQRKGYPITVVFDGWRSGWTHEVEQRRGGIRVIFSQQGEKADSVIQRLASEMGSGCVVVTSDRDLRRAVEARSAVAIYAAEFSTKLRSLETEDEGFEGLRNEELRDKEKKGNPRRLSKEERKRRVKLKKL